ncbi:MAG: hypothetical protein EOP88_00055 [Verrucomicrobiaceae bacterium]|nr:MAG: hypothetical protein EOP88_00055 [Verrucomicrobiaceae bacterium]
MILEIVQILCCIALAGAAIYWRVRKHPGEGAHKFLFPVIIATGLAGCLRAFPPAIESYLSWQRASLYEVVGYRFGGPYWWVYVAAVLLPLLPVVGMLPSIGKRSVLMAVLALLAMLPATYFLVMFR